MRQVKIDEHGIVEKLFCPMTFNNTDGIVMCCNTCAWFNIQEFSRTSKQHSTLQDIVKVAYCGDKVIGEIKE